MTHELTRDWPHGYRLIGSLSSTPEDVQILMWDRPGEREHPIIAVDNYGTIWTAEISGKTGEGARIVNKPAPKLTGTVHVAILQNPGDPKDVRPVASGIADAEKYETYWKIIARLEVPWTEGQGL